MLSVTTGRIRGLTPPARLIHSLVGWGLRRGRFRRGFFGVESAGQLRFLAGGLIRMDNALGGRLIQLFAGDLELSARFFHRAVKGGLEAFQLGLDALLDSTVMQAAFGNLP